MFDFFSKQNPETKIKNELAEFLKYSLNTDYLVFNIKLLKVNINIFIKKLSDYIINELKNKKLLLDSGLINNNIFNVVLSIEFIQNYISTVYISDDDYALYKINTKDNEQTNKSNIKLLNNPLYPLIEMITNYYHKDIEIFNNGIIINSDGNSYIYTIAKNLTLYSLREFAFKIDKKYKLIVMDDTLYDDIKKGIEEYVNNKIIGLNSLNVDYIKYYLINSLIDKNVGDLNFTYFFDKMKNRINSSVRYKGKYKFFDIKNASDIDVNYIENDILLLGGNLSGIISYTKIQVGKAEFRILIIRKEELYYLNIRPFNSGVYAKSEDFEAIKNELLEYGNLDITPYKLNLVQNGDESSYVSNDGNAILNHTKKMQHASLNFPLSYSKANTDAFLKKLIVPKTSGLFFLNGPVGSGKSSSLMNFLEYYYDYNVKYNYENKNVLMVENPIEMFDSYFKQIQIDDEDLDDYKSILMAIKRADTDLISIGELRNVSLFSIVNEISMSQPVITTFHVSNIRSFLELIIDYSEKNGINYKNVFARINYSICQLLLEIEDIKRNKENAKYFYDEKEKELLLREFYIKLGLNKNGIDGIDKLKILVHKLVDRLWEKKMYPLKLSNGQTQKKIIEEGVSSDDISNFLLEGGNEGNLYDIYKYSGYENTILYKTLVNFAEGKMILTNLKFEEISLMNKIRIIELLITNLK